MCSIALFNRLAICFILSSLSSSKSAYADFENSVMLSLAQSTSITRPSLSYTSFAHLQIISPPLKKCIRDKYQHYTQASISWYESITKATVKQDPTLEEVAYLFLDERKKYLTSNLAVFSYYLDHSPEKLNLSASVESWLNLDQEKLENTQGSDSVLIPLIEKFNTLKEKNRHENTYKLRAAFAELLSKPANIQAALNTYNQQIQAINRILCDKQP